jgi:hypothetical protein
LFVSSIGQSKYFDGLLKSKRNGFFIEAGGYDGETHSNSLYFELERDWTGILIEPIPSNYKRILSKGRNIYVLNACIAEKKPIVSKFRVYDALSGRLSEMNDAHQDRIDKESNTAKVWAYIPCFSLNTILKAIDVDTIDYFSLEGGEFSVVQTIDYKRLNIRSFSIEHNGFQEPKMKITNYLLSKGYNLTKSDGQDIYFLKHY